jgi:energy-coupling factor transport system ATP-binding protein
MKDDKSRMPEDDGLMTDDNQLTTSNQVIDISVDSLSFTYPSGIEALRHVSLHIAAGESLALIGQNGAGKTTLVKHFNGLLKPTAGSVQIAGQDTRQSSVAQLARQVGYVFQNPDDQLFKPSVLAEVKFGPQNLGWETGSVEDHAQAALRMVELEPGRRPPSLRSLPWGAKRVALAVLAMDTPVIILDEPTTGQDYAGVRLVGQIVDSLIAQGKTVITITHDIDFCAEHFERVVVMAGGRILIEGPSRVVLSQAEILAQTYVEPPQLMRLASRLGMEWMPLTVDEFITHLPGN